MENPSEPRSFYTSSRTLFSTPSQEGLYLALISIHGLVRGENLELGRNADTGGQVKYVVELARALAEEPGVSRVDLLTRLIEDQRYSSDYAAPLEPLSEKARIVRIPCGPKRYVRKEGLWPRSSSLEQVPTGCRSPPI